MGIFHLVFLLLDFKTPSNIIVIFLSEIESHSFSASHHKYTLFYKEWYQKNDVYKTQRPVRRRPAEFVTKQNMKDIAQRYLNDFQFYKVVLLRKRSFSVFLYFIISAWSGKL